MNNSEQFLYITILNKNSKCVIHLNEEESIEKIKEICKQKLEFGNIDINKINLCFIDGDKEKNIIPLFLKNLLRKLFNSSFRIHRMK